ncbi:polysaccharide deacetylase family protein [Planctomycetota bacterium]|nr:polysaccharide deacetylase family protein [Planctomycetota bacterium]
MPMKILLSFDVEEFDIPVEFGQAIREDEQFSVSVVGMKRVLALLDEYDVKATCFTTANFADHERALLGEMGERCEIASHGYWHSSFEGDDLEKSRLVLEELSGQEVRGFRRARFAETSHEAILKAGYTYNSSENPIWMPGRYNHFFKQRRAYMNGELLNVPISASPGLRVPLFWLGIKNFPKWLIRYASWHALKSDGYLNVFFHPWEFSDIRGYELPGYVKGRCGEAMVERLAWYLKWLKERGAFVTFSEFAKDYQRKT